MFTLITGASSGIGRAIAVRLSADRPLILHGRDFPRLEQSRLLCAAPERHVLWPLDLQDVSSITASLTSLLTDRRVTAFVHCAGAVTVLPMRSTDHKVAQALMNVNFFSAVEIVNVLLKKAINDRHLASIIFISSIFSRFGAKGHAAYCASKAALDGLMRALAVELAPAIRVNSILPGAMQTNMSQDGFSDPEIVEKLKRDYPMGIGEPTDIADAVEFVLSSKSRWLTGQQIAVDGGRTANMSLK
jgi:NAD(P)-dependent dehydrogenase (short-subunit alcohol dehydrogenase family)